MLAAPSVRKRLMTVPSRRCVLVAVFRSAQREQRAELSAQLLATATAEGAPAVAPLRAEALRLRPCLLSAVFIAAGALELELPSYPERQHLAELVLSLRTSLPAGWREELPEAGLPRYQHEQQPVSAHGPVAYSCALCGLAGGSHPFRAEVAERMDAAHSRAEQLLARRDASEGVQWDDSLYEQDSDEEEEALLALAAVGRARRAVPSAHGNQRLALPGHGAADWDPSERQPRRPRRRSRASSTRNSIESTDSRPRRPTMASADATLLHQ